MNIDSALLARNTSRSWPMETLLVLAAEWNAGTTTAAIGVIIGKSKNSVVGKAHRLKLSPRPSPIKPRSGDRTWAKGAVRRAPALPPLPSTMLPMRNANNDVIWTPQLETWLMCQVAMKRTNAQIGVALGCSGNAVLRKLDAMVAGRAAPVRVAIAPVAKSEPPASSQPSLPVLLQPVPEPIVVEEPPEPEEPAPRLSAEAAMDASRQDNGCAWPIDNGNRPGRRYRFCGKPVARGSYCADCAAVSYRKRALVAA